MAFSPQPPLTHLHPSHSSSTNSFPVIAIAIIGILATAFLLITYYIFVIKCCLNWHRVDFLNRFFSRVRDPNEPITSQSSTIIGLDTGNPVQKGLEEAVIRSIPVIKFRKVTGNRKVVAIDTEPESSVSYECAVCLSEFEEGEKLRVIPNCCHAFHIDCIDVWLQSNANCPLCRSGISPSSILYNAHIVGFPNSSLHKDDNKVNEDIDHNGDNNHDDNDDDDDFVVIEIERNNFDEPRLVNRTSSIPNCSPSKVHVSGSEIEQIKSDGRNDKGIKGRKKIGYNYSMGDEFIDMRKKNNDEEFKVEPIRRSISMDLSNERDFCIEIQEYCRSNNREESEVSCGGSSSSSNSNKVRRSIFSFGYGRSSRCSVKPVHLDP